MIKRENLNKPNHNEWKIFVFVIYVQHAENVTLTRNILKSILPIGYTVVKAEQQN
jgi:hypothetical protein